MVLTPSQLEEELVHLRPISYTPEPVPKSTIISLPIESSCVVIMLDGSYSMTNGVSSHGFCAWRLPDKQFLFGVAERNDGKSVNESEYKALTSLLWFIRDLKLTNVHIIGDSQLIINQVRGTNNVLNDTLKTLHAEVKTLSDQLDIKEFYNVARKFNAPADQLSIIGRTAERQMVFYESSDDFTKIDNDVLWEHICSMKPSQEEAVNEDTQDICFVMTRSQANIQFETNNLNPLADIETNPHDRAELTTEDTDNITTSDEGEPYLINNNSKFIELLQNE